MMSQEPKEYITLRTGPANNFAEIYPKRYYYRPSRRLIIPVDWVPDNSELTQQDGRKKSESKTFLFVTNVTELLLTYFVAIVT